jgi:iron complex outermembrane receptor protein
VKPRVAVAGNPISPFPSASVCFTANGGFANDESRIIMKKHLIAAAISGLAINGYADQTDQYQLNDIVVTASRFAETNPAIPANISVITRQEIQTSPAMNLPDLLKTRAGINVVSLYGQMATNASVDLRGFGDTATSNTLILLDGQRLNPIDGGGILWSAIPLNAIERIEIVRGSGSVLYGDRASGGVINIITDKSTKSTADVSATFGNYGYKAEDAHAAGGSGKAYFNLTGHHAETDGWRRNSQADESSLAGSTGYRNGSTDAFLDLAAFKDESGTPGAVFTRQYQNQPDMARYPYDNQKHDGVRLRPGFSMALGKDLDIEGELGYVKDHYLGYSFTASGSPSYTSDRTSETWSVTPRLRWRHGLGEYRSETVLGLDYYDGRIGNDIWSSYTGTNTQRASQTSQAVYVQNTTGLTDRLDLTLGARNQSARQSAEDADAGMNSSARRSRTAWEAGLSGRPTDSTRLYAKVGRTFRFPNTDELFGFDPITYATIFRGDLKPQQGTIREVGASWQSAGASLHAGLFQSDLTDEIAYDGTTYTNVNLPATRHQGLELEGQWLITDTLHGRLAYAYTEATFREGSNAGNDIPAIPHDHATLELTWQGGKAGTWSAVVNYTGHQRYSGDDANLLAREPGYTTADLRADWNLKPWLLTARVTNLFDRHYASSAGYSTTYSDYYYYPADPRSLFVSARYNFR